MSDKISIIDDFSNARTKQKTIAQIGALQGIWRIEICKYRPRRTDRQNRWYWPCFCKPFADYLRDQGNDIDDDGAHEILKCKFLSVTIIDKETGREFEFVRSTTTLITSEFNEYLEKCARMLAKDCGIVVPEPSIFREPEGAR